MILASGADGEAVVDDQYPDRQFGIDRRPARVAVIRRRFRPHPAQVQSSVDPPQKMTGRNHVFQIEFIKKAVLPTYRLTHHRPDPLAPSSQARNYDPPSPSKDFFGTLGHKRTQADPQQQSCFGASRRR
jgi:hypothetical protein